MGNEEEEVEEEKAICMEKDVPHTSWDTRRARGIPEKSVPGRLRLGPDAICCKPSRARAVPRGVGYGFCSTLAALPGSNNVLGLWGEGFLEAPAEAPWALLGSSWERF